MKLDRKKEPEQNEGLNRRGFIHAGLLSAAAIALLSGSEALAAKQGDSATSAKDVELLNQALAAEQQAVAAYQVGAGSGLLSPPIKSLALEFQGHHKTHADLLASTVSKLGGKAVEAKRKYDFPVAQLKTQADVLRFAASLEKGAVAAYVAAIPKFGDRELSHAAATILGDEAMHWATLRNALGEPPVPAAFVG